MGKVMATDELGKGKTKTKKRDEVMVVRLVVLSRSEVQRAQARNRRARRKPVEELRWFRRVCR